MPAKSFSIDGVMIQDIQKGCFTNTPARITYSEEGTLSIDFTGEEYSCDTLLGVSIDRYEGETRVTVYDSEDTKRTHVISVRPQPVAEE